MKLVDRYVREVGENLPVKMRADIEAEIRSLIEDTLEERSQTAGRPVDEAMEVEVLKEFGAPAKMAASYLPPRYLIGPRLYPTFMLVMRIVLIVVTVTALISLGVSLSEPGLLVDQMPSLVGTAIAELFTSVLAALGNVVFIFAILEWVLPKSEEKAKDWDPRKLEGEEETERVKPSEMVWAIFFNVIAILIFNLYPMWMGFPYVQSGRIMILPVFSEAFFRYIPWFTLLWALEIGLYAVLMRTGHWETWTRWAKVVLKGMGIVILAMIVAGPSIIDLQLAGSAIPADSAATLEQMASFGARIGLILALVVSALDLVKMLYRMVVKKITSPVVIR